MIASILGILLASPAFATIELCGTTPPPRSSPCRPSQAEVGEIMRFVKEGNAHHAEFLQNVADEDRLRKAARNGQEVDLEAWNDLRLEVARQKGLMETAYQEAITKAGDFYGVRPSKFYGDIAGGLLKTGRATWNPTMHEEHDAVYAAMGTRPSDGTGSNTFSFKYEDSYRFKNPETGEEIIRRTDSATLDMGATFISVRVFQRALKSNNPAVLATTLAFEAAKFDALTGAHWWSPGWRFKEHVANAALADAIKTGKLVGIDDGEMRALESRQQEAQYAARIGTWGGRLLNPGYTSLAESNDNAAQYAKDSAAQDEVRQQQAKLTERLEKQRKDRAEQLRRESREQEWQEFHRTNPGNFRDAPSPTPARPPAIVYPAIPATPASPAIPTQPSPKVDKLALLNNLAARGCGSATALTSEELRRIWMKIAPMPLDSAASDRMQLSGCQRALFDRLMGAAADGIHPSLDTEEFQAFAATARSESQPILLNDEPTQRRQDLPWCMQAPGRRCIP